MSMTSSKGNQDFVCTIMQTFCSVLHNSVFLESEMTLSPFVNYDVWPHPHKICSRWVCSLLSFHFKAIYSMLRKIHVRCKKQKQMLVVNGLQVKVGEGGVVSLAH